MLQLNLESVQRAYEGVAELSNEALYQRLVDMGVISNELLNKKNKTGKSGTLHSPSKRKIRWMQQTLKQAGIIEPVEGKRGIWSTAGNDPDLDGCLNVNPCDIQVLGFRTDLGMSIWGDSRKIADKIDQPIQLCISSLPYPLQNPRAYGNKRGSEYIDFVLSIVEPITRGLADGGSIVLNFSNNIFTKGRPSRSTYLERLTIALEDDLGLELMDRIVWHNPNQMPTPTYWCTSKKHPYHLKSAYEPLLWFTNNASKIKANNRTILRPNSAAMENLYRSGGESRITNYGDGAHSLHERSFKMETEGTLQGNVISIPNSCSDSRKSHKIAKGLGLPTHGAMFPTSLPSLLIEWLSEQGDLIFDPCSGSGKVALAAERLKRKWVCVDRVAEYIQLQRSLFMAHNFL